MPVIESPAISQEITLGHPSASPQAADQPTALKPDLETQEPTLTPHSLQPAGETSRVSPPTVSPFLTLTSQPGSGTAIPYHNQVRLAVADLAERLEIPTSAIELVSVSGSDLPAGDLGCPAPGETPRPIPAFTSGQVIVLQANGDRYVYHAKGEQIAFCGSP